MIVEPIDLLKTIEKHDFAIIKHDYSVYCREEFQPHLYQLWENELVPVNSAKEFMEQAFIWFQFYDAQLYTVGSKIELRNFSVACEVWAQKKLSEEARFAAQCVIESIKGERAMVAVDQKFVLPDDERLGGVLSIELCNRSPSQISKLGKYFIIRETATFYMGDRVLEKMG